MDYSQPAIQRRLAAAAEYAGLPFLASQTRRYDILDGDIIFESLDKYSEKERDRFLDIYFMGDERHVDLRGSFPNAKRVVKAMKRIIKLPDIPLKKLDAETTPSTIHSIRSHLRMLRRTGYDEDKEFDWLESKKQAFDAAAMDKDTGSSISSIFNNASNYLQSSEATIPREVDSLLVFNDAALYVTFETLCDHENWARPLVCIRENGIIVSGIILEDGIYRARMRGAESETIWIDAMKQKDSTSSKP